MKRLLNELLAAGLAVTFRPDADVGAAGGEVAPGNAPDLVEVELSSGDDVVATGLGDTPKDALWVAARLAFESLHDLAELDSELDDEDEDEVQRILSNPIYAGLGGFERLVEDDQWIAALSTTIGDEGARPVLERVREALETTFGRVPRTVAGATWLDTATAAVGRDGAGAYLRALLGDLREELGP